MYRELRMLHNIQEGGPRINYVLSKVHVIQAVIRSLSDDILDRGSARGDFREGGSGGR